jgi:hypothetical protein
MEEAALYVRCGGETMVAERIEDLRTRYREQKADR